VSEGDCHHQYFKNAQGIFASWTVLGKIATALRGNSTAQLFVLASFF